MSEARDDFLKKRVDSAIDDMRAAGIHERGAREAGVAGAPDALDGLRDAAQQAIDEGKGIQGLRDLGADDDGAASFSQQRLAELQSDLEDYDQVHGLEGESFSGSASLHGDSGSQLVAEDLASEGVQDEVPEESSPRDSASFSQYSEREVEELRGTTQRDQLRQHEGPSEASSKPEQSFLGDEAAAGWVDEPADREMDGPSTEGPAPSSVPDWVTNEPPLEEPFESGLPAPDWVDGPSAPGERAHEAPEGGGIDAPGIDAPTGSEEQPRQPEDCDVHSMDEL